MNDQIDGIRKVAILLTALDRKAAELVLRRMEPDEAENARRMADELGDVDPAEQRRVVDEFMRVGPMVPAKEPPGIELDGRLAEKLSLRPSRAPNGRLEKLPARAGPPFGFLHETEKETLAEVLSTERPQTIALVLSHLPPAKAGEVLGGLAPTLQIDVLRRLVDLEETDPEILHEVEHGLRSRLSAQVPMQRRRVAGTSAVAGILQASDPRIGTQILDNLAGHDRALADRLNPCRLRFEELADMDNVALRAIVAAVDPALLTLSLTGAEQRLTERMLAQLSSAEAGIVRRRLANPGPTRLSDVEEARRRIAEAARRLVLEQRARVSQKASRQPVAVGA